MDQPPKSSHPNLLEGPKVEVREDYGGLGLYYAEKLYDNLDKIHHIDTVTGITETNGSVRSRAFHIAQELQHRGLVENDVIVICSRCHADQTVVVLASLLLGTIIAPIDPMLPHNDCTFLLQQLRPKLCFCDLRTLKQMERAILELDLDSKMIHFSDQQQYATAFRKLLTGRQHMEEFVPVKVEQPRKKVGFILHTQGTTGSPKLVCLSHHFLYCQTQVYLAAMNFPQNVLSFYPLSRVSQVILTCVCFEVPEMVRVLTGSFAARMACKFIQDLKIDHVFLTTTLALKMVSDVALGDFNLSSLKCMFVGGVTTGYGDLRLLMSQLPRVKIAQMYCTTETGTAIACSMKQSGFMTKVGTVGKVVQNCKLRIVDLETRKDVEPERLGELLVRGDCNMLGYFKSLRMTTSSMNLNYFKTGDVVRYDRAGWVYLEGKVDSLLTFGNQKVPPRQLEETLSEHPFIKDVVVIGNDNDVVACVIGKQNMKLDEQQLLKFLEGKVDPDKVPQRVIFMDSFPTTTLGELKRDRLREEVFKVRIEICQST